MMGHKYSLEKVEIFKLEDIIIENVVKEGVVIEEEDVRSIKKINLQICQNKNYALLIDAKAGSTITDPARALLASAEMSTYTIAKAVLIHTKKQKILGNLHLSVNRPHVKTRLFTDREKAITWLKQKVVNFSAKELLKNKR